MILQHQATLNLFLKSVNMREAHLEAKRPYETPLAEVRAYTLLRNVRSARLLFNRNIQGSPKI